MNKLTGNKNVDIEIINQLSDEDLTKVCQVNSYIRNLCNDNTLWRRRISLIYKFPYVKILEMYKYLEFENWKEYYLWLTENHDVYHIPLKAYVDILLKSFKNINLIDVTVNIISSTAKFPKWVNKIEYLKELKRYILLNLYDEINPDFHERENNTDYDYLTSALLKALNIMNDFIDNVDVYTAIGKILNTDQIHNIKNNI